MNESYQHPGKWHDFWIAPPPIRLDASHFIMSHVIRGLEHNAVYEAIVQAKNRYGWNEVSTFRTYRNAGQTPFILEIRVVGRKKFSYPRSQRDTGT